MFLLAPVLSLFVRAARRTKRGVAPGWIAQSAAARLPLLCARGAASGGGRGGYDKMKISIEVEIDPSEVPLATELLNTLR